MPTATRTQAVRRLHALTGAPALLLGWGSLLVVGWRLLGADAALHRGLGVPALLAWWSTAALVALVHAAGTVAWVRQARGTTDEGRALRVAAGALSWVATALLLAELAPAAWGGANAATVYAAIDARLATLPGAAAACVLGAAAGLYLAEELPRAARALGLVESDRRRRASQVTSIALGAILFALTMNLVSHFSAGTALLGVTPAAPTRPGGAP